MLHRELILLCSTFFVSDPKFRIDFCMSHHITSQSVVEIETKSLILHDSATKMVHQKVIKKVQSSKVLLAFFGLHEGQKETHLFKHKNLLFELEITISKFIRKFYEILSQFNIYGL